MEKIDFTIKVFDNFIEITPIDGVKDNSIYTIKLKDLKEETGHKILKEKEYKICTKFSPCYATILDVKTLLGNCEIPEQDILYHIREASRFTDYIKSSMNVYNIYKIKDKELEEYQKKQLTKYKATYECLLRFYMDNANSDLGIEGTLGEVSFKTKGDLPDISDVLKTLKEEIEKWTLALQGINTDIKARITSGVKSSTPYSYYESQKGSQAPEFSRRVYTE